MTLPFHKFKNAKIIDNATIEGEIDGMTQTIDILHGGLPAETIRVTLRDDKRAPDNGIIIGAFIEGRVAPITVIGKVRGS